MFETLIILRLPNVCHWTLDDGGCNTFLISLVPIEYAAVGYIAKRIEMRKKRYQNLQKLAEQRRAAPPPPGWMEGPDGETAPTVAKSHVTITLLYLLPTLPIYT